MSQECSVLHYFAHKICFPLLCHMFLATRKLVVAKWHHDPYSMDRMMSAVDGFFAVYTFTAVYLG
jgi:succinate dehydrogenase/fumarate reductase cytochrome b subunit